MVEGTQPFIAINAHMQIVDDCMFAAIAQAHNDINRIKMHPSKQKKNTNVTIIHSHSECSALNKMIAHKKEQTQRIYEINHVFKICEYVSFRLMCSTSRYISYCGL